MSEFDFPGEVVEELDSIDSLLGEYSSNLDVGKRRLFTGGESLEPGGEYTGEGKWGERLNGEVEGSDLMAVEFRLFWNGPTSNPLHYTRVLYVASEREGGLETGVAVDTETGYSGSGRYMGDEDEARAEQEIEELLESGGIDVSDSILEEYGCFWRN